MYATKRNSPLCIGTLSTSSPFSLSSISNPPNSTSPLICSKTTALRDPTRSSFNNTSTNLLSIPVSSSSDSSDINNVRNDTYHQTLVGSDATCLELCESLLYLNNNNIAHCLPTYYTIFAPHHSHTVDNSNNNSQLTHTTQSISHTDNVTNSNAVINTSTNMIPLLFPTTPPIHQNSQRVPTDDKNKHNQNTHLSSSKTKNNTCTSHNLYTIIDPTPSLIINQYYHSSKIPTQLALSFQDIILTQNRRKLLSSTHTTALQTTSFDELHHVNTNQSILGEICQQRNDNHRAQTIETDKNTLLCPYFLQFTETIDSLFDEVPSTQYNESNILGSDHFHPVDTKQYPLVELQDPNVSNKRTAHRRLQKYKEISHNDYYMLQEIGEQPELLRNMVKSLFSFQKLTPPDNSAHVTDNANTSHNTFNVSNNNVNTFHDTTRVINSSKPQHTPIVTHIDNTHCNINGKVYMMGANMSLNDYQLVDNQILQADATGTTINIIAENDIFIVNLTFPPLNSTHSYANTNITPTASTRSTISTHQLSSITTPTNIPSTIASLGCQFTNNPFQYLELIQIIACGSSFHAGMLGKYFLESFGKVLCTIEIASEYIYRSPSLSSSYNIRPLMSAGSNRILKNLGCAPVLTHLHCFISQSGETSDTISAVQYTINNKPKSEHLFQQFAQLERNPTDPNITNNIATPSSVSLNGNIMCDTNDTHSLEQSTAYFDDQLGVKPTQSNCSSSEMYPSILSLVNVDQSTLTRHSDWILRTQAGVERAVASTKAFLMQALWLFFLSFEIAVQHGHYQKNMIITGRDIFHFYGIPLHQYTSDPQQKQVEENKNKAGKEQQQQLHTKPLSFSLISQLHSNSPHIPTLFELYTNMSIILPQILDRISHQFLLSRIHFSSLKPCILSTISHFQSHGFTSCSQALSHLIHHILMKDPYTQSEWRNTIPLLNLVAMLSTTLPLPPQQHSSKQNQINASCPGSWKQEGITGSQNHSHHHKLKTTFILGRGYFSPIAMECALKLKELTYLSIESVAAGEIKHGPLSVVDENVLCIVLCPFFSHFDHIEVETEIETQIETEYEIETDKATQTNSTYSATNENPANTTTQRCSQPNPWFYRTCSNIQEIIARNGNAVVITDEIGFTELQKLKVTKPLHMSYNHSFDISSIHTTTSNTASSTSIENESFPNTIFSTDTSTVFSANSSSLLQSHASTAPVPAHATQSHYFDFSNTFILPSISVNKSINSENEVNLSQCINDTSTRGQILQQHRNHGSDFSTPFAITMMFQYITYFTALFMGKDVDQPRNLAKSVTVE